MALLNLAVLEREELRIAADEEVARLRRVALERADAHWRLGPESTQEQAATPDGVASADRLEGAPTTGLAFTQRGGVGGWGAGRDELGTLLVTEVEARALEALNGVQAGFCKRAGERLSLAMYCGLILLPRGRRQGSAGNLGRSGSASAIEGATLEILPKIWAGIALDSHGAASPEQAREWSEGAVDADRRQLALARARRALLRLLQSGGELPISPINAAPQGADELPLLDLFIRGFLREVLRVAKGGLLTRYIEITDDQSVLRGRAHLTESERLAARRPGLWRCTRDDLSVDNPYNQTLLAAVECCRPHLRRGATERLWLEARAFFGEVSIVRMGPEAVDRLKQGRESARYREALRWARMLLALLTPTLAAGASMAPALLFNMQSLFERWVAHHEDTNATEGVTVQRKGAMRLLATIGLGGPSAGPPQGSGLRGVFRQMPDVLLWPHAADRKRDAPESVVDAKWKWLEPARSDWGVEESDARQVLGYLLRFGCQKARLAYPILSGAQLPKGGPPTFWIDIPGGVVSIEVKLIPIDA